MSVAPMQTANMREVHHNEPVSKVCFRWNEGRMQMMLAPGGEMVNLFRYGIQLNDVIKWKLEMYKIIQIVYVWNGFFA